MLSSYFCAHGAILAFGLILYQCGASTERKDLRVPPNTPELKSIAIITDAARHYTAAVLPDETHQSFPIPLRTGSGLKVTFLYCVSRVSFGEGLQLLPPSNVGIVNALTGVFEELRAVRPADFGLHDPENQFLGKYALPQGITQQDFHEDQTRLLLAYDALLPRFAINDTNPSPDTKRAAVEFKALFKLVAEQVLQPYYRAAGKQFFAWLDQVSP